MSSFQLSSTFLVPAALGMALLTSACGVPVAVSAASYAADGGLLATSDKTSTDHIYSVVTKQDCAIWRIFKGRQICTERADGKDPYNTDYTEPQRSVSESGVDYAAPLRPASDAPAVSWDPAVYRTAPTAAAEGPMTATVEPVAGPAPPTKAAPPGPPGTRKAKAVQRSAKKPSRGRVATAP